MGRDLRYNSNILIRDDGRGYIDSIRAQLDELALTRVGDILLRALARFPFEVTVTAEPGPVALAPGEENAIVYSKGLWDRITSSSSDTIVETRRIALTLPLLGEVSRVIFFHGLETGGNCILSYDPPKMHRYLARNRLRQAWYSPVFLIYHELVHVLSRFTGIFSDFRVEFGGIESITDEVRAITATNVFLSNMGRSALRGNHEDGTLALSELEFYRRYRTLMDLWFFRNQPFFTEMAGVRAAFNPFRLAFLELKGGRP